MASTKTTEHKPTARSSAARQASAPDVTVDLVDRTAHLSEEVLASVESGQRAAALDMADKPLTTQYDFLRIVERSAAQTRR